MVTRGMKGISCSFQRQHKIFRYSVKMLPCFCPGNGNAVCTVICTAFITFKQGSYTFPVHHLTSYLKCTAFGKDVERVADAVCSLCPYQLGAGLVFLLQPWAAQQACGAGNRSGCHVAFPPDPAAPPLGQRVLGGFSARAALHGAPPPFLSRGPDRSPVAVPELGVCGAPIRWRALGYYTDKGRRARTLRHDSFLQ